MAWYFKVLCDWISSFHPIDGSLLFAGLIKTTSQNNALIYAIIVLALAQALVQLLFFLHVGQEAKPRWETRAFCFMVLILLIIVIGSLWVMHDLNDRMMSDTTKEMPHD